jgi:hypothetical protein
MRKIILGVLIILSSVNAFAIQFICKSPDLHKISGKAKVVYRYNSEQQTAERFVLSRGGYALFSLDENLSFTDNTYRMTPLRRVVTVTNDEQEILNATWSNGSPYFIAEIAGESQTFTCEYKD